jgi:CRP/FNR family transcriptional regulator, cyclic AMP receptor protein
MFGIGGGTQAMVETKLSEYPLFASFDRNSIKCLAELAQILHFTAGQYLAQEAEIADRFFLITSGAVALEIAAPGKKPIAFETVPAGEIVAAAWLEPPYLWPFDARAKTAAEVISLNIETLRGFGDVYGEFAHRLTERLFAVLVRKIGYNRDEFLEGQRK